MSYLLIILIFGGGWQLKNLCITEVVEWEMFASFLLLCRREWGKGGEGRFRQLYPSKLNQRSCS